MRIRPVSATQSYGSLESRMAEFPVRALSARHELETGGLEVGDELANFPLHEVA
jgi:hypothetical protein